jgi:hypothetical protein
MGVLSKLKDLVRASSAYQPAKPKSALVAVGSCGTVAFPLMLTVCIVNTVSFAINVTVNDLLHAVSVNKNAVNITANKMIFFFINILTPL